MRPSRPWSLVPAAARGPLRAVTASVVLVLAAGGAQCRTSGTTSPHGDGGTHGLDAPPADPDTQRAWDQLEQARAHDLGGAQARALADEILAGNPPLSLRLAALRAKAEHAYRVGADPEAIAAAEEGLTLGADDASEAPQVLVDLARVRLRALVRGGDPAAAIAALEEPLVHARGGLTPLEEHGLRAVAADRNGDGAAALRSLVSWRELLPNDDPSALWAEHRVALLAEGAPAPMIAEALASLPQGPGRACLAARLGEAPPGGMPPWVQGCATASGSIGVLLPRTGAFAAFADEQLAATLATIEVLGADGPEVPLHWEDSGATVGSARAGARALLADGSRVVVGPIGAKQVEAVADDLAHHALMIVPGEGRGAAHGVAPSLESRVDVLVDVARKEGRDRLVVLAPDNAYGRRAVAAVEAKAKDRFAKPLVIRTYPPDTTSFGPHVNPVMTALGGNAAVLVPDTLARTEMVVRQLARAGRVPAHGDVPGLMVLATAEGVDPARLQSARDVLEGVWVVPAAARGSEVEAFEAAYRRLQGTAPGDQGLLVFFALQHAITGRPGFGEGLARLTRVEGGRLVVQRT